MGQHARWSARLLIGLAAFALSMLPVLQVCRAEADVDRLTDTFVRIVERSEFGSADVGLARWDRRIRLAVAGRPLPDQRSALGSHIERASTHSGLPIEIVQPIATPARGSSEGTPLALTEPGAVFQIMYHLPTHDWTSYLVAGQGDDVAIWRSDLLVMFTDHASSVQIARILRLDPVAQRGIAAGTMPCFGTFYIEPAAHVFRYAIVVLRTDLPEWMRRRCLHEELTQVLGLRNDVKGSEITLFDDMPMKQRTELTAHDWMFLEVLYDPRLKPGARGAELRRVARELIAARLPPR